MFGLGNETLLKELNTDSWEKSLSKAQKFISLIGDFEDDEEDEEYSNSLITTI